MSSDFFPVAGPILEEHCPGIQELDTERAGTLPWLQVFFGVLWRVTDVLSPRQDRSGWMVPGTSLSRGGEDDTEVALLALK